MTPQSQRSAKIAIYIFLVLSIIVILLSIGILEGWIKVSETHASQPPIAHQGTSPYCLFAVTAYLTGQNMWDLETTYHRNHLPLIGTTPYARSVIDLARKTTPITIGTQWDTDTVQQTVQNRPVAVTGNNHALVLVSWKDGQISYLDSLHPEGAHTMTDQAFWAWWDGWAWWVTP